MISGKPPRYNDTTPPSRTISRSVGSTRKGVPVCIWNLQRHMHEQRMTPLQLYAHTQMVFQPLLLRQLSLPPWGFVDCGGAAETHAALPHLVFRSSSGWMLMPSAMPLMAPATNTRPSRPLLLTAGGSCAAAAPDVEAAAVAIPINDEPEAVYRAHRCSSSSSR